MHLLYGEKRNFHGEGYRKETRRAWMERSLSMAALAAVAAPMPLFASSVSSLSKKTKWSTPGLFPGRVAEVSHGGSIIKGQYQREAVRQMLRQGMVNLTGAPDWVAAWRMFFQPGEVVGLKLNPVSKPYVISSAEVVQEIVACLEAAGIKRKDIVAYDRYKKEFLEAGFDKWLPEGVRWTHATDYYDNTQQRIDGYDPDHYMDMQLTLPGFSHENDRARRSYAARFITKDVDKLVNLCLLKHHQSAGITNALKNLSHGLVNNVNRSHSSPMLNACGTFIPAVMAIPIIQNKSVLHICDAVQGLAHGGPGMTPDEAKWVFEHKKMYFSTDPVAIDRVGREELDQKRVAMGMLSLQNALRDPNSNFVRMQPEHVEIAGALGLGEADLKKIDWRKQALA
jgi:hypothetical protein